MRPSYRPVVGYSSGQRGQTVNLLGKPYTGSNPVPTTTFLRPIWVAFFVLLLYKILIISDNKKSKQGKIAL